MLFLDTVFLLWECAVKVVKEQLQQNHFCLNILLFNLCFIRRHDIEQTTLNYIERYSLKG